MLITLLQLFFHNSFHLSLAFCPIVSGVESYQSLSFFNLIDSNWFVQIQNLFWSCYHLSLCSVTSSLCSVVDFKSISTSFSYQIISNLLVYINYFFSVKWLIFSKNLVFLGKNRLWRRNWLNLCADVIFHQIFCFTNDLWMIMECEQGTLGTPGPNKKARMRSSLTTPLPFFPGVEKERTHSKLYLSSIYYSI